MNIIELSGLSNDNNPAPQNVVSDSDRLIASIPDLADGTRLGRYWWQADRGFVRRDKDTGRAVWYDRLSPGAKLKATTDVWPTRSAIFTSTPATGSKVLDTLTVAGTVRMNAEGNILDSLANTVYLGIRPTPGLSALIRYFGASDTVGSSAPTDDVLNFGAFNGILRLVTEDAAASVLTAPSVDYRDTTIVVRVSKSTVYGSAIAVNGVEVARDAAKNSALINRTFSLFGLGATPESAQFHGSIRHLMLFTGADFSKDPYFAAADAIVTARLKADLGIV